MNKVINPTPLGGGGGGLVPTIRATAPVGSTVTCDGQTKVVGAEGFVDFVVSAEPVNILPDGVQGLEYIESTGGQYINLGLAGEPKEWTEYPTYTVTVNGTSKSVMVDKTALFSISF